MGCRIVSTGANGGQPRWWRRSASAPWTKNPSSHITVIPAPLDTPYISWNPDGLTLWVSFPTEPSSPYRVLLSTGGADRYGQPLAEALDLNFVTDRRQPSYSIFRGSQSGTFNAYLDPKLMVSSVNLDRLDFQLYAADAANLIAYESGVRFAPPASSLLRTWSESLQAPPLDKAVVTTTRLAAVGSTLPEGVYFIRLTSPAVSADKNISDDMFFVVSSVNVVTKWTQHDILVWLVDMNTGAPLTNVTFQLLDKNGGPVRTMTSGSDGIARADVKRHHPIATSTGVLHLASSRRRTALAGTELEQRYCALELPDQHQLPVHAPGISGLSLHRPSHLPARRDRLLQGHRPVGRRCELLHGLRRRSQRHSARDEQGRLVDSHTVTLSGMGTFNAELALSPEAATGVYSDAADKGAVQLGRMARR